MEEFSKCNATLTTLELLRVLLQGSFQVSKTNSFEA